jgi:hypothetical protein
MAVYLFVCTGTGTPSFGDISSVQGFYVTCVLIIRSLTANFTILNLKKKRQWKFCLLRSFFVDVPYVV